MTYRQLFKSFQNELAGKYEPGELNSMFFLALDHYASLSKMDYFMHENYEFKRSAILQFDNLIAQLSVYTPIQYVLGVAWFKDHKYFVDENVLVPRSETEELIQIIQQKRPSAKTIIDIGTGSGCIAIELALIFKSKVFGLDISEKALKVAEKNAEIHKAKVDFIHQSILNENLHISGKFDIIISNPPYVMDSEKAIMPENVVNFEPKEALFVPDNDPLLFYKAIRNFAITHATKDALVAVEINEQLGLETAGLFSGSFKNVTVHKDIHGKDRFVTAIYDGE